MQLPWAPPPDPISPESFGLTPFSSIACAVFGRAGSGVGGTEGRCGWSTAEVRECWPTVSGTGPHRRGWTPGHGEEARENVVLPGACQQIPLSNHHGATLSPSWVSPLQVRISVNKAVVVEEPVGELRALWEETSFQLDLLQAEPRCVIEEKRGLKERTGPSYYLPPTFPVASVPCKPGK